MEPLKILIDATYKRESGLWVLDIDKVNFPEEFEAKERSLVYLPPQQIGGNHKHPRIEAIIGIGDLEIAWLDEQKQLHKLPLNENGQLSLTLIPTMLPHAVFNKSRDQFAILFEYANETQHDVELVKVL